MKEEIFSSQTSILHVVSGKRVRSVPFAFSPLGRVRTPRMRWEVPRERKWEAVSRPIPGGVLVMRLNFGREEFDYQYLNQLLSPSDHQKSPVVERLGG